MAAYLSLVFVIFLISFCFLLYVFHLVCWFVEVCPLSALLNVFFLIHLLLDFHFKFYHSVHSEKHTNVANNLLFLYVVFSSISTVSLFILHILSFPSFREAHVRGESSPVLSIFFSFRWSYLCFLKFCRSTYSWKYTYIANDLFLVYFFLFYWVYLRFKLCRFSFREASVHSEPPTVFLVFPSSSTLLIYSWNFAALFLQRGHR